MRENLSLYGTNQAPQSPVSIISIPLEYGSDVRGFSKTPAYLYAQGLENAIRSAGCDIQEKVHITCPVSPQIDSGDMKYLDVILSTAKAAQAAVFKSIHRGHTALVLGGDHAISVGTIAGAQQAVESLGIIWIDAHPDINTHATSRTGNIHGMAAAAALGLGHESLAGFSLHSTHPDHFLYLGLKDMDDAEVEHIVGLDIAAVTMFDIAQNGLDPAIAAIDALQKKVDRVWISMDLDSIDERFAPGVGMPSRHGFTEREIDALAQYIGRTCDVAGLDIVEVLPDRDAGNVTAQLTLSLIARFLGGQYGGYQSYIDAYEQTHSQPLYTK